MKIKKSHLTNFLKHLWLFLLVEIIFVFLVFREFPPFNLLTLTGILHTSYRAIILWAWILREYFHTVWKKFLATYIPLVYHVFIHLYVGFETVEQLGKEHENESISIIIATILVGALIAYGEYRLHRKDHCDTHHLRTHKHCHDTECITPHEPLGHDDD